MVRPVGWEAQHDLTSMLSVQEQAIPCPGPNNHMIITLTIICHGKPCAADIQNDGRSTKAQRLTGACLACLRYQHRQRLIFCWR